MAEPTLNKSTIIAYRLPGQAETFIYNCLTEAKPLTDLNLDNYDFVFAPYNAKNHPIHWFKFLTRLSTMPTDLPLHSAQVKVISKSEYLALGHKIKGILSEGELNKLVFSRTMWVPVQGHNLQVLFNQLCSRYPNAFCYCVYLMDGTCWMGATPEILISNQGDNCKTVALAGTQKFNGDVNSVVWQSKEQDEQKFIETFIEETFAKASIEYKKGPRVTVAAGRVCHIKSEYYCQLDKNKVPLLNDLHPGPALTGYPKAKAIDTIDLYESHDRKYYTGYLGTVGTNNNLQLYVNLRCCELYDNGGLLYLGGGYTMDSDPELEWEETELKASTMKSVLESEYLNVCDND